MAHYVSMLCERLSFFLDVIAMRFPAKKRFRSYYKYCNTCGWANRFAGDYTTQEEKYILKQIFGEQNSCGLKGGKYSEGSAFGSEHQA